MIHKSYKRFTKLVDIVHRKGMEQLGHAPLKQLAATPRLLIDARPHDQKALEDRSEKAFKAFGASVDLVTPNNKFIVRDTEWRVRHIYEPYFCSRNVPHDATVVDIGAGFGGFAIPFAIANPTATVWCFEPDRDCFNALKANIARAGLHNVVPVPAAVVSEAAWRLAGGGDVAAIDMSDPNALMRYAYPVPFVIADRSKRFLRRATPTLLATLTGANVKVPSLPATLLARLTPQAVKLIAPGWEDGILKDLADTAIEHIVGESWSRISSAAVFDSAGPKANIYLCFAGKKERYAATSFGPAGRRNGLDVVVAMYNDSKHILECVEGIVGNDMESVRAIVVDDGSTDGCGDLVAETYRDNPRVRVVRKPNGGCASARNFGRRHSTATHIAFVDSDDVPDPKLFPTLLELSRATNAEMVQGGFDMLHVEPGGERRLVPSYEGEVFARYNTRKFYDISYCHVPSVDLMIGQPTIWRRVYRRDFLDNRRIFFPEHIRAYDDQIFQMLCLQYTHNVPHVASVAYHYRQHAGQDIKQGDERHFNCLSMFRMLVKRGLKEGWPNMAPLLRSYTNTVNWSLGVLKPSLQDPYLRGAAELWVLMEKALGQQAFSGLKGDEVKNPSFYHFAERYREALKDLNPHFAWSYLDGVNMQPAFVKMGRAQ